MAETFREKVILTLLDKLIIAAILVGIGLYANEHVDLFKSRAEAAREKAAAEQQLQQQRINALTQLVQRQLNELYYPLYFRLAKDDAVWDAMLSKQKYGARIEDAVVLPNNQSVLSLLESHTELIFRPDERRNPELIDAFLKYERHMAVYLGLRASGDRRRPADLDVPVSYPQTICHLLSNG